MKELTNTKPEHISLHLGIACSVFSQDTYETACFQELVSLMLDDDFKRNVVYAIYCDEMIVKENIFVPKFHTYYLHSDTKDVVILDEKLIDLPKVYNHHRYYIYGNKKLLEKFEEQYDNITYIESLRDIINVPTNE